MWREWGKIDMHTGLRQGTFKERDYLEDIGVDWWIILQQMLE
jgi:hypothetical protein